MAKSNANLQIGKNSSKQLLAINSRYFAHAGRSSKQGFRQPGVMSTRVLNAAQISKLAAQQKNKTTVGSIKQ